MDNSRQNQPSDYSSKLSGTILRLVISIAVITLIVIAIALLLRGKLTTSGSYPNPIETSSLICTKQNISYPKIPNMSSNSKTIEVSMVFNGSTSLVKIAISYILEYKTKGDAESAEALAHAQFSKELGKYSGFSFTEFNNKFSVYDDKLVVSLYGSDSDFYSEARASFFMVDIEKHGIPKTLSDFQKVYKDQGFSCISTTDD